MNKTFIASALTAATLISVPLMPVFAAPKTTVTICHATGSNSNPYNTENPAANADVGGHNGHANDIIPPFDFTGGSYPGKNWTAANEEILANDCKVPTVSVTPTSTPTPGVGPSVTPTPTGTQPPPVPEFGLITGLIALGSSAGAYYVFKKRS